MTPTAAERIAEAQHVLEQLGFPAQQTNERSALVLLSLLGLPHTSPWADAGAPMLRTVEIMEWIASRYGRHYKANTRETIRRQTLHQFVDAGLVVLNPDDSARPVNSPRSCYQLTEAAAALLRTVDHPVWEERRRRYLAELPGLVAQYAKARELARLPVTLTDGTVVELTPGGQNLLIRQIIEDFCSRWIPAGHVLYIGDAGSSDPVFDAAALSALGVVLDKHGKFPDIVVYDHARKWLWLIEAAASHGPVDAKRHAELSELFRGATPELVFVSCFPSRTELRKYVVDVAWETEVWCADSPTHLIHFDGDRFLA